MQNPHVKYLKTKKGYLCLFYYEHGNILFRSYAADGWTNPKKVAEHTAPVFSLCQYEDTVHLLYTDPEGQLSLLSSRDLVQWERHPMPESVPAAERAKFFLLPTEDAFHMIYNRPTESTGIDFLAYTAYRGGQWEKPYRIDRFMPLGKTPFFARRLSREHIILYYRTGRNILSAREMLLEPYTMGSVTPLIQTPSPCVDFSIVNDSEKIHMLYIVRGMFRTQVVYQYKHTAAISTPRVLWEDANCDNCLIWIEGGRLMLMWTANGQPLRCTSDNGGSSFGAVERYTEKFPSRCIKAELLGAEDEVWNSAEVYADADYLPCVLPNDILPAAKPEQPKPAAPTPDFAKAYNALQETHKQQLEELSLLLAQRSDEISAVNARWKAQTAKLEAELSALRAENERLKHGKEKDLGALPQTP